VSDAPEGRACRAPWRLGEDTMLRALGYACYGFAVVDLATYWLGIADITGVSWSPFAAAVIGSVLVKAGEQSTPDPVATQTPALKER
jgi:hypothetical protein